MGAVRPLSYAARRRLRTGRLGWGVALVVAWLGSTIGVARSYSARVALDAQSTLWVLLLPGAVLLTLGLWSVRAARAFNRLDSAFADALGSTLDDLWRTDKLEAYRTGSDVAEVSDARLVEIERHFDQQSVGNVVGRMSHQLSFFGGTLSRTYGRLGVGALGGAVNGLTRIGMTLSGTSRDNLMGDALFAVVEARGPGEPWDTFRVVSVSAPNAAQWVRALLHATAEQLEGPLTHAGSTVLGWSEDLVAQFAPQDISYATDRLKAQAVRAPEQRDPLSVRGPAIGRNALLAAQIQIGAQEPLLLFPAQFPVLFGRAVATAAHQADAVTGGPVGTAALGPGVPAPDLR